MSTCSYKGDSKFYDFEKHKRKWFDCKHVLEKHNDMPTMDCFVKMLLNSIDDPCLDQEKVQLMRHNSTLPCTRYHEGGCSKDAETKNLVG